MDAGETEALEDPDDLSSDGHITSRDDLDLIFERIADCLDFYEIDKIGFSIDDDEERVDISIAAVKPDALNVPDLVWRNSPCHLVREGTEPSNDPN